MTLIEVMISLLILSIVSVMSMNILGGLNLSVKKINESTNDHRGFTGVWRLLESDFFENSYIFKNSLKKKLFVDKNTITFPNGVIWQWSNGMLTRKSNDSSVNQRLEILKNVQRLELHVWQGKKFVPYSSDKIQKSLSPYRLGFKVTLVQNPEVAFYKIFVLNGNEK